MNKKIIYILLIIFWLTVIFIFSSNNASESNGLSKGLIGRGIKIYEKITNKSVNTKKIVKKLNYPVRKVAHYSVFFVLGIFIYLFISTTKINHKFILSLLICILCACFDEIHQIFTFGRTAKVFDVFIDTLGSLTSILILKKRSDK